MVRIGGISCDSTWKACSSQPKQLIDEFEDGVHRELVDNTFSRNRPYVPVSRPLAKRKKIEASTAPCEGYTYFDVLLQL